MEADELMRKITGMDIDSFLENEFDTKTPNEQFAIMAEVISIAKTHAELAEKMAYRRIHMPTHELDI